MSEESCPSDDDTDSTNSLVCARFDFRTRSAPQETLYQQLEPFVAREVTPEQTYGICRDRSCPVLYFSFDYSRTWKISDARTTIGFKQPTDQPPHPVCYCFGYTEENIANEIDDTGESTVVEWITERVRNDECACKYKNSTGNCCLRNVRNAVEDAFQAILR